MRLAEADGCALPFAIMLFAGARPVGELSRISRGSLKDGYIEITGDDSKTGDDRHIPVLDNLQEWLEKCKGDDIQPSNWKRRYQSIRKAAGVSKQDVWRHSFASSFYKLKGEHETVLAMGHSSFKTTEKFYKRAVTIQEAKQFFSIAPVGMKVKAPKTIEAA